MKTSVADLPSATSRRCMRLTVKIMWHRLLRRCPCGPLSVVRRPTPAARACITSSASDTRSSLRYEHQKLLQPTLSVVPDWHETSAATGAKMTGLHACNRARTAQAASDLDASSARNVLDVRAVDGALPQPHTVVLIRQEVPDLVPVKLNERHLHMCKQLTGSTSCI